MRPRPKDRGNLLVPLPERCMGRRRRQASMRPRPKDRGNGVAMGPGVDADTERFNEAATKKIAETPSESPARYRRRRFNEAATKRSRKRDVPLRLLSVHMVGFNEAATKRSRKPESDGSPYTAVDENGFNEAATKRSRKRGRIHCSGGTLLWGFNEAATKRSRKLGRFCAHSRTSTARFNEAATKRSRKPGREVG